MSDCGLIVLKNCPRIKVKHDNVALISKHTYNSNLMSDGTPEGYELYYTSQTPVAKLARPNNVAYTLSRGVFTVLWGLNPT